MRFPKKCVATSTPGFCPAQRHPKCLRSRTRGVQFKLPQPETYASALLPLVSSLGGGRKWQRVWAAMRVTLRHPRRRRLPSHRFLDGGMIGKRTRTTSKQTRRRLAGKGFLQLFGVVVCTLGAFVVWGFATCRHHRLANKSFRGETSLQADECVVPQHDAPPA